MRAQRRKLVFTEHQLFIALLAMLYHLILMTILLNNLLPLIYREMLRQAQRALVIVKVMCTANDGRFQTWVIIISFVYSFHHTDSQTPSGSGEGRGREYLESLSGVCGTLVSVK